jgi:single-strand DNA-binding protein
MIIGHLGQDPEPRVLPSGDTCTTFSVATTRRWTSQQTNETREQTEWHNIVAWRRLGETCFRYLRRGSLVYIEGRVHTRSWVDAETGRKVSRTEIYASSMNMLDRRPDDGAGAGDSAPIPISSRQRQGSRSTSIGRTMPVPHPAPPAPDPEPPEDGFGDDDDFPF